MSSVSKFIGYIDCEKCGYQYLTEIASIIIWYAQDCSEQLIEAICPKCKRKALSTLDRENFLAFKTHGVKVASLNDKFKKLTEEDIINWDIGTEIESL